MQKQETFTQAQWENLPPSMKVFYSKSLDIALWCDSTGTRVFQDVTDDATDARIPYYPNCDIDVIRLRWYRETTDWVWYIIRDENMTFAELVSSAQPVKII